jgi:hypothetical protein
LLLWLLVLSLLLGLPGLYLFYLLSTCCVALWFYLID